MCWLLYPGCNWTPRCDRSCPENTIAHPGRYGVKECQRVSWKSWPKSICWQPKNFICSGALQVVTESQQLISANRFFKTVHFKEPVQDCSNQCGSNLCHHVTSLTSLYVMTCWNDLSKSCCRFFFNCRPINYETLLQFYVFQIIFLQSW